MGHLNFEEDFIGIIVGIRQYLKGEFGQDQTNYMSDLCIFDKNGRLGYNTQFAHALYQNDTLLSGGYSKIDKIKNYITLISSVSDENPYTDTVKIRKNHFDFYGEDENYNSVELHLK